MAGLTLLRLPVVSKIDGEALRAATSLHASAVPKPPMGRLAAGLATILGDTLAWTLILPYLLSTLSDLGGHQVMNTTNLMIGAGFALGPVISGVLIENGGFTGMITFSLVAILASLLCVLVVQRRFGT